LEQWERAKLWWECYSPIQGDAIGGAIAVAIRLFGGGRTAIMNKISLFFLLLTYWDEQNHQ
jgi:hypothetical protein